MKKIITLGGMLTLIIMLNLDFNNSKNKKEFEYYDLKNNYGTSTNCNDENDKLTCLIETGWIEVKQYSEVTNE